ncbi:hypothetical protein D3C80_2140610 [compost metagenome]
MTEFASIIDELAGQTLPVWESEWQFHVSGDDVAGHVLAAGAQVVTETPADYTFIPLRAA